MLLQSQSQLQCKLALRARVAGVGEVQKKPRKSAAWEGGRVSAALAEGGLAHDAQQAVRCEQRKGSLLPPNQARFLENTPSSVQS
tara:strand:+ start:76 stop:330 length:255 start_codon:yes stop_codon:yes gene_type:complete